MEALFEVLTRSSAPEVVNHSRLLIPMCAIRQARLRVIDLFVSCQAYILWFCSCRWTQLYMNIQCLPSFTLNKRIHVSFRQGANLSMPLTKKYDQRSEKHNQPGFSVLVLYTVGYVQTALLGASTGHILLSVRAHVEVDAPMEKHIRLIHGIIDHRSVNSNCLYNLSCTISQPRYTKADKCPSQMGVG